MSPQNFMMKVHCSDVTTAGSRQLQFRCELKCGHKFHAASRNSNSYTSSDSKINNVSSKSNSNNLQNISQVHADRRNDKNPVDGNTCLCFTISVTMCMAVVNDGTYC